LPGLGHSRCYGLDAHGTKFLGLGPFCMCIECKLTVVCPTQVGAVGKKPRRISGLSFMYRMRFGLINTGQIPYIVTSLVV